MSQTIGVASTWEPELVESIGSVIKDQMRSVGAHQALHSAGYYTGCKMGKG